VIDAEKALNDQLDVLRLLLQIEGRNDIGRGRSPQEGVIPGSEDEVIRRAFEPANIKELKRTLEINELQTRVYGNNIKPDLKLIASAGVAAVERTYPRE